MTMKYIARLKRYVALIAVAVALVVAPTLVGSPVFDQAGAQAVQTRVVSCAGFNFQPIDSRTPYQWNGRQLYRWSKEGDGWFMCAANLPHKATVTRVRFTLKDSHDYVSLEFCGLIRTPLTVSGTVQALGMSVTNTGAAQKPGVVRYSDSSISFATVDNANYAYSLQCRIVYHDGLISSQGNSFGIIGADVTYTISAANG
jgi:hypothetical protein